MRSEELREKFRGIGYDELENMPDHSELFWIKEKWIYRDKLEINHKGKEVRRKNFYLDHIEYYPYRVRLEKFHHQTVAGYLPCIVSDPNAEYPYMVPWSGDWIYLYENEVRVRKET